MPGGTGVTDEASKPGDPNGTAGTSERLDSWKEIAAYLKRDVTTVRRWEKRESLPVHRHLHERRDSVYAFPAEIDAWWRGRRNHLTESGNDGPAVPESIAVTAKPAAEGVWLDRTPTGAAWLLAATFFLLTLILGGVVAFDRMQAPAALFRSELRFSLAPPGETMIASVALAPNGRQVAFTAAHSSGRVKATLWIQSLDSSSPRMLGDSEDAAFPFWAPDGRSLGFFAAGKLWVVDVASGRTRALADVGNARGGSWNQSGVILFSPDREGGIYRVSAAGGAVSPVTTVTPEERGHVWPHFLPDGRHFLYLADSTRPEHHSLFAGELGRDTRIRLVERASSRALFGAGGFLFFADQRALVAQAFDPDHLALSGERIRVVERVDQPQGFDHYVLVSVAETPVLAYRSLQSPATRIVHRDEARVLETLTTAAEYYEPTLSPDETRVALDLFNPSPSARFGYGINEIKSDVVVLNRATGALTKVTTDPGAEWGPVWSPDGTQLVYSSNRREQILELYLKSLTSDAPAELLVAANRNENPIPQSWSPDGKVLVYSMFNPKTRGDLWMLPMTGDRKPVPLLTEAHTEWQAQISPNGRWIAYASNESGRLDVYVRSFPVPDSKWHVSPEGGGDPRWSKNGSRLFFVSNDRRLMAVDVKSGGSSFAYGSPVALFDTGLPPEWYEARNLYDVARDGTFVFMAPVEDDRAMPLTMVVNPSALTKQDRRN